MNLPFVMKFTMTELLLEAKNVTQNKSMKDAKKEKSLKDGNATKMEDHQSVQKS